MNDIIEDNKLSSIEKEFSITVNKAEQVLVVHSEIGSISRALLTRDDFKQIRCRKNDEGVIVAVSGELPMGTLRIGENGRSTGSFNSLVASHD